MFVQLCVEMKALFNDERRARQGLITPRTWSNEGAADFSKISPLTTVRNAIGLYELKISQHQASCFVEETGPRCLTLASTISKTSVNTCQSLQTVTSPAPILSYQSSTFGITDPSQILDHIPEGHRAASSNGSQPIPIPSISTSTLTIQPKPPIQIHPPSPPEELQFHIDTAICGICCIETRNVTFMPCGHLIACQKCASKLSSCPICRDPIRKIVFSYIS